MASLAFDAYADNIREADLLFLKTGPSTAPWSIERYPLDRTSLQFGADGGARVVHGTARADAVSFLIQTHEASEGVLFDGRVVKWNECAFLAPGAHFTFAAKTPTQWVAVTLPPDLIHAPRSGAGPPFSWQDGNCIVTLDPESATGLAALLMEARADLQATADMDGTAEYTDRWALERRILRIANDILAHPSTELRTPDRRTLSIEQKMTRALEYIRSKSAESISVDDLANNTACSTRELHRLFRSYLDMGPKEYLKYRQLNLVRRALRLDRSEDASVTRIMADHGVSEFGRFATEFHRLFDELPSETFHRCRIP